MACTVSVVQASSPERDSGQGVDAVACCLVWELERTESNVSLQHQSEALLQVGGEDGNTSHTTHHTGNLLLLSRSPKVHGSSDVSRSIAILGTRVTQIEFRSAELAISRGGRAGESNKHCDGHST